MPQLVYSKTKTLGDTASRWENTKLILNDCNIHVYTNDAKYGNILECNAIIFSNAVAFFRYLNLNQLVMKNETPASASVVTIVGTIKE